MKNNSDMSNQDNDDIDGPVSAAIDCPNLIGNTGKEFVRDSLEKGRPIEAVPLIQEKAAFKNATCRPLLGFLDQLGVRRKESHEYVLNRALESILKKIPNLSTDKLVGLLEETFPFIGIHQLRSVPLAVLDRLHPIPVPFMKQLAMDNEVFWDLPSRVQRQVWTLDKNLLRRHALSLIAEYKYEEGTWRQGLNMELELELGVRERKAVRQRSLALGHLVAMVGSKADIFRGVSEILTETYGDKESSIYVGMKEAAVCACKTQLLMSLYDAEEAKLCATDPAYSLAWLLDSCIKEKGISDKKLKEIDGFFLSAIMAEDKKERQRGGRKKAPTSTSNSKGSSAKPVSGVSNRTKIVLNSGSGGNHDAESAGLPAKAAPPAEEYSGIRRTLGEASMCLRDPCAFHLIVHEIIKAIKYCVEHEQLPRDNERLLLLTKVLVVPAWSKEMFRSNEFYYMDPGQEIMGTLYPLLCGFILDGKLDELDGQEVLLSQTKEMAEARSEAFRLMIRYEVARKVIEVFALERLANDDEWMAESLLDLVASCLAKIATPAIPEFAPFAYSLARRVSLRLKKGTMRVGSELWKLAVEKILLNLVDSETEAHVEILNMLQIAWCLEQDSLDVARLGRYLDTCLEKSAKSRQLYSDRALEQEALPVSFLESIPGERSSVSRPGSGATAGTATTSAPGFVGDVDMPGSLPTAMSMEMSLSTVSYEDRYNDGVFPAYARIAAACPAVLAHAPIVNAYLG